MKKMKIYTREEMEGQRYINPKEQREMWMVIPTNLYGWEMDRLDLDQAYSGHESLRLGQFDPFLFRSTILPK